MYELEYVSDLRKRIWWSTLLHNVWCHDWQLFLQYPQELYLHTNVSVANGRRSDVKGTKNIFENDAVWWRSATREQAESIIVTSRWCGTTTSNCCMISYCTTMSDSIRKRMFSSTKTSYTATGWRRNISVRASEESSSRIALEERKTTAFIGNWAAPGWQKGIKAVRSLAACDQGECKFWPLKAVKYTSTAYYIIAL